MKKIGAVTIGQAPRTDVMEDLAGILQGDVELIQAGALDSLTLEEVKTLRPDGTGNTLVSRMRDGTGVMLQEQKISFATRLLARTPLMLLKRRFPALRHGMVLKRQRLRHGRCCNASRVFRRSAP